MVAGQQVPASYVSRDMVEAGLLMSYGTNIQEMFRQVGSYAGRGRPAMARQPTQARSVAGVWNSRKFTRENQGGGAPKRGAPYG